LAVKRYSPAMKVLDCFSNDGGFALHCASTGASVVIGIDDSADAVRRASTNAQLNQLENVRFEKADVFKKLQEFATLNETFDLIILDPPSFTKSKKNVVTAKKGYRELNAAAIRLLNKNGILVSASCSHHITSDVFLDIVNGAARDFGRDPQLLEWREAAPDHPTVPGGPETRYLKLGILRLLSR
jgi:23S rRNA (cytosine1962-C5)-methyltransferase